MKEADNSPEYIASVFRDQGDAMRPVRELAEGVTRVMEVLDPLIESHTSVVCPSCSDVCCINRHSCHDLNDVLYLHALGEYIPFHKHGVDDDAPCQFLGEQGCLMKRSLRPYRCTWFFCEPLLDHIRSVPAVEFREFIGLLESLTRKREEMTGTFFRAIASPFDTGGNRRDFR